MITELRNQPFYTIKHTNGSFLLFCFFRNGKFEFGNLQNTKGHRIPKTILRINNRV